MAAQEFMKIMVGKICHYNRSVKIISFCVKGDVCEDCLFFLCQLRKCAKLSENSAKTLTGTLMVSIFTATLAA